MRAWLTELTQPFRESFAGDLAKTAGGLLILIVILHGVAATHLIVLFLDGAYYLFGVINQGEFISIEPTSRTVQFLQQAPVILALWLGLDDLESLMILSGLANLLLPLLLTASCYWILPNQQKAFFIFPLLHYLTGALASWFPTLTDAPPAAAYFWVLFYLIIFRANTRLSVILCGLIALPALYLHEALSFLAPFLIIAALWRFKNAPSRLLKALFLLLSGWFTFISYTQFAAILYPRDVGNRSGFFSQLLEWQWIYWDGMNVAVVLSLVAAILLLWVLVDNVRYAGRERAATAQLTRQIALLLMIGVTLALSILLLFNTRWYGFNAQFAARGQAVFVTVPLAILVLVSILKPSIQTAWQDRLVIVLITLLTIGILGSHSIGLSRWNDYVQDFRSLLQNHVGFIPFAKAVAALPSDHQADFQLLSATWTNPTISYLLSHQGRVAAIVGNNPRTLRWQPFNPCDPIQLPKGEFDTTPYLEVIAAQGCAGTTPYGARLYGHVQFSQPEKANFISEIEGLYNSESWGRWSDGDQVVFRFNRPLPEHFTLVIVMHAYRPNIGAPITVTAGTVQATFTAQAQPQTYALNFNLTEPTDTLTFTVPEPVRPRDLGIGEDERRLGLGFGALQIYTDH
jgi:hypothetical protein